MSQSEILNYLKKKQRATTKEMSDDLKIGRSSIQSNITKLLEKKDITVIGQTPPNNHGRCSNIFALKGKV